jgi:hypothetical protein
VISRILLKLNSFPLGKSRIDTSPGFSKLLKLWILQRSGFSKYVKSDSPGEHMRKRRILDVLGYINGDLDYPGYSWILKNFIT